MKHKKAALDPVPVPVEANKKASGQYASLSHARFFATNSLVEHPNDRCKKVQRLRNMLHDQSSPVVRQDPPLDSHDERDTEVARADHDRVADGQFQGVASQQIEEGAGKNDAGLLVVADDGLKSEEDWARRPRQAGSERQVSQGQGTRDKLFLVRQGRRKLTESDPEQ